MLVDEVGERAEAAGAGAGGGEVEAGAVRVQRVGERVDALHRAHARHRQHRASRERRASRAPLAGRAERAAGGRAEVGLGDDEHVGDLHDPRLQELQRVAGAGLDDDDHGLGGLGDVGLGLADADGLDHHQVERGGQRLRGGAGGGREAAEPLAGGHRADEDVAVGGVVLDPRAVAEQRAAAALGGRVDGEHRDRAFVASATRAAARRAASTCRRRAGR